MEEDGECNFNFFTRQVDVLFKSNSPLSFALLFLQHDDNDIARITAFAAKMV